MTPKYSVESGFKHRAWLYSFVFFGRVSLLVVLFLLFSFIAQPIDQALANSEESPVAEDVAPQEPADVTEENGTEEEPDDSSVATESTAPVAPADVLELGAVDEEVDVTATTSAPVSTSTETDEVEGDGQDAATSTATSTIEVPVLEIEDGTEEVKTLEEIQNEVQQELNQEVVVDADSFVSDENFFQFDRQSCVAMGSGSYHCTVQDAPSLDESTVVYADRGENGSMQIFIRTANGGVRQLTDTVEDNTSPNVSAEARQVAWQRLIDGRYQIFLYDIEKAEERQLTFSRTNNMEPKVSVDGIVWQAWDGNDWEIMYFDGTYTDQITDNVIQDVAPAIEDRYILWSVLGTEKSEAKVYSLDNKETLTITGQEGGTIANPRFVLVYDTEFENGDIITQGFDPVTGESAPLGAKPAPEPIEIPDADPLGEARALVNVKTYEEGDLDELLGNDVTSTSTLNLSGATSTPGTLDLSDRAEDEIEVATTTPPVDENEFELGEFDLVIHTEPSKNSETTSTSSSSSQPVVEVDDATNSLTINKIE